MKAILILISSMIIWRTDAGKISKLSNLRSNAQKLDQLSAGRPNSSELQNGDETLYLVRGASGRLLLVIPHDSEDYEYDDDGLETEEVQKES
mmetsp:Transcript_15068/g.23150  ORF Transcript_15068/g.23150 Transcript_15068/m.23150 type:complete len:92 (-) Transcript_15068:85-360(-)